MAQKDIFEQISNEWDHQSQLVSKATRITFQRTKKADIQLKLQSKQPNWKQDILGNRYYSSERCPPNKDSPIKTYSSNFKKQINAWNDSFYKNREKKVIKLFHDKSQLPTKTFSQINTQQNRQMNKSAPQTPRLKPKSYKSQEPRIHQSRVKKTKQMGQTDQKVSSMIEKHRKLLNRIRVVNNSDSKIEKKKSEGKINKVTYFMYPCSNSSQKMRRQMTHNIKPRTNYFHRIQIDNSQQNSNIIRFNSRSKSPSKLKKLIILND